MNAEGYHREYWKNGRHARQKRQVAGLCAECGVVRQRSGWYCDACRQKVNERSRAARLADPITVGQKAYVRHIASRFKMTTHKAKSLAAAVPSRCEVCGKAPAPTARAKRLDLDHNHTTGALRGWICRNCNRLLGFSGEDRELLRALIRYLDKYEEEPTCIFAVS